MEMGTKRASAGVRLKRENKYLVQDIVDSGRLKAAPSLEYVEDLREAQRS